MSERGKRVTGTSMTQQWLACHIRGGTRLAISEFERGFIHQANRFLERPGFLLRVAYSVGRRAQGVAGHFDEAGDVRQWLARLLD